MMADTESTVREVPSPNPRSAANISTSEAPVTREWPVPVTWASISPNATMIRPNGTIAQMT